MTFKENKYKKIYFDLIEKRKTNKLNKENQYCETHHIIPKCMGGNNEDENLVNLTPREHFIAHKLLIKITSGSDLRSMWWALHRIIFSAKQDIFSSKDYEKSRIEWSKFIKENHHSKRIIGWNEKMSKIVLEDWKNNDEKRLNVGKAFSTAHKNRKLLNEEEYFIEQKRRSTNGGLKSKKKWEEDTEWAEKRRKEMSIEKSGENHPMYGKHHTDEAKRKMGESTSNRRWIYNEFETKYVNIQELEYYIKRGYKMGRNNYKRKNKEVSQ